MEAAARASLATKEVHPKTRTGVWRALTNKMVHSGEMAAETADHLVKERQKRAEAEYVPLTEGTEKKRARDARARAASLRRRGGTF